MVICSQESGGDPEVFFYGLGAALLTTLFGAVVSVIGNYIHGLVFFSGANSNSLQR